ncbi:hypothetical protein [Pseudosporangium ferrugineum]|uniref:Uncharacterized protein n=1 Tax=Pseudosporangium ferrugineum TaxID=439699 RepID=A0A2T0RX55_9ACTN|nr:hypothetical protein [Pseudosporangium ferrugineum]PRY25764.1 hypothetical protein CLV70_112130 [Pseudosporangium ferrugineum]
MIDNGEKLREAFEKHETQTPDPAAVYARVQELSRTYQRRRWGAQAAGGAVLGAGLIAGVMTLPGLLPGQPSTDAGNAGIQAGAPAAPSPLPSLIKPKTPGSTPTVSAADLKREREREAFFNAGYDYDDAVELAKIWKMETDDIGSVKAAAGKKLLAGKKLPIEAGSAPEAPAPPTSKEDKQVDAFFNAGYDYDDAAELAKIWHKKTPYDAKVLGGKKLLAGETLPIQP